jgi:hypothetical protein
MLTAFERPPPGLFWSAPLATDSDFTLEDPLALDYLGQQVGLWLFSGFTTRTARAQNYAVVLYGLHLADKAVRELGVRGDDATRIRLFERWEQFWALATLESRSGEVARGSDDSMRGIRGAKRAWFPGAGPLPLGYPLISRQSELGSLGAYLTSLREYRLVISGSLRPTPAAREILDAFWSEPRDHDWNRMFEDYAMQALDLGKTTIARQHGRLTLAGVGKRSRLTAILGRPEQQARLWNALFLHARDDSTLALANQLIASAKDGIRDSERLLEDMAASRWGSLPPSVLAKVELALAFGRVARLLLGRFDAAYGTVDQGGWVVDSAEVAVAAFPPDEITQLREAVSRLLECEDVRRFKSLAFHGPPFVSLLSRLAVGTPLTLLERTLAFHRAVQRVRRGGGGWLRDDGGKLVMQVAGYNGYKTPAPFPTLKLGVVSRLLRDLGKLS